MLVGTILDNEQYKMVNCRYEWLYFNNIIVQQTIDWINKFSITAEKRDELQLWKARCNWRGDGKKHTIEEETHNILVNSKCYETFPIY